jgi:hypothetical protein
MSGFGGGVAACGPLDLTVIFGPRYFYFCDNLEFASDVVNASFAGEPEEIYYNIDMTNHLIGVQGGGQLKHYITPRLRVRATTLVGVYNNHIRHRSRVGGSAGTAVINNGPNTGMAFDVFSTKDDVAFLGELRADCGLWLNACTSIVVGYRGVAVTGVGLPTSQIYWDFRSLQDVVAVDSNDGLLLHGGYANLEFNY